jgi:hypothetical protein
MKQIRAIAVIGCLLLSAAGRVNADTTVTVDPGAPWLGFMNVFELPSNGGGFVFGSGWGVPDLTATFSGPVLTLGPNSVNDTSTFWYQGGGGPGAPGNKIMEANMYVEVTGPLAGQAVTFEGLVLSNTLTSAHSSVAFIKDFAPDYSSAVTTTVPLTPGVFSLTLNTINNPARHVQYGFATTGVNVWVTDRGPFGEVQIVGIPEPAGLIMAGIATLCLATCRRRL